ncbi:MAG: putative membrane protein YphA (DoxX/SURF4 family) [Bacteroidia bacterium]|jgi:uncharacterized membrane protein YphA (DoxX/SURF4 family)
MVFAGSGKLIGGDTGMTGEMGKLMVTLGSSYLMVIGGFEVVCGLLLAFGKMIPVALTIITAIMFNAVLFHILKNDASQSAGAAVGLILALVLIFLGYKNRFKEYLRF